jgi:AraC-like DNA-binding protein
LILYDHKNQKIVSHYFENTEFRSLVQTSETEIWAGSLSEGLYHFKLEPETGEIDLIRIYEQNSGLETNVIFSAFVDSDKGIWLGSYDSFFYKSKEGASFNRVEMQLKDTLIKKVQVWTFFEDHSGRIWIGTQRNGLFYYEKSNGKFFRFFSENKNADERINAVKAFCQADSNSLFVGTEGNGLFNIDFTSEKVFVFNESDGLQNNSIWSILPDPDEGLWLSTNKGITKFSDHRFQNYSVSDGLPCSEFNPGSGLYMNDSLLIFGCTRGLTGFNPSDIEPRNFNPECAFTEVFVNDHIAIPVHEDSSNYILDLPRGKYNIQIRFSAFEFSSPQKVNYLYKLEGWNTTWISTNAENRKVYYYSLPPGKYTFHLKTALNNEDWKWADEKLIIHIAQPWQKNKYVLVAIVLLIITTGYILYRRKSKLSAMIGERVKTGNVFLGKAQSIVHKHIDDPRFSVEQLASELSMSRSSLHKKLKSATRQSASSFIRDIRLEKARVMLIEENVSVKEAAYRCGFSDSSYFTKCFKQKYGMLPTAV